MTKRMQIYKCEQCGIIAEVLNGGVGKLVCCGEAMKLMEENTVDASKEKHVPVVEKTDGGIRVAVGSVSHPMEDKHYIEWIEVVSGGNSCKRFLKPGDAPEASFDCACGCGDVIVRAYCNLHGLWKA